MVKVPFAHYLTEKEKAEALAEMRSVWTSTNISKFAEFSSRSWRRSRASGRRTSC